MIAALEAIDRMISEEAEAANRVAGAAGADFDRLRMGTGSGIRLEAFQAVRAELVKEGLRQYERSAND